MSRLLRALLLTALPLMAYAAAGEPPETNWLDLLTPEDRHALETMPEIGHDSPEAPGGFSAPGGLKQQNADLPAVMHSTRTVNDMNGRTIRLGGFPVPLQTDAKDNFREFFLVPYPGACIHVPPPPPNQIVLVRYPKGVPLPDIYEPYWVIGTLRTEGVDDALAQASYTLDANKIRKVEERDL